MNILDEIKKLNETGEVKVEFNYLKSDINSALKKAEKAKKLELTTEILRSWYKCEDAKREIFSEEGCSNGLIMFTLTANGQQFRAWIKTPGYMGANHVDSCGRGVLLGVYGDAKEVYRYVLSMLHAVGWSAHPAVLPNGVKLYVDWK